MIRLENAHYAVGIDPQGRIVSLVDRAGGYDLIAEPRLAGNFRLLLPLPGYECNYLDGCGQSPTSCEQGPDSVTLRWDGPLQNEKGVFDLAVTLRVALVGETVQFNCEVRNGTEHKLAEVWYPVLGGLRGIGPSETRQETQALVPTTNSVWLQPIFRDFGNTRGETLGVTGAEHSFYYPGTICMPWVSLYHLQLDRALYFAALEETPRVKMIRFNLDPGIAEARAGGNWPRPDEVGDLPLGLTMNWTHVPYTAPGETFTGSTIVLQAHAGGWQESAKIYRQWFDQHFEVIEPNSTWVRRETAFSDLMFLLPEDNVNLTFAEIPQWAADVKARGVNHVMISGWHIGGHDRGYPQYDIDPRLGTWEELETGVRACHKMGLKVSFFGNCQPVDMSTDWFKRELINYQIQDPYGQPMYIVNYWGMGTLSARSRFFTARPFCEINPAHPEVRELLISRFVKLAEIGADGLHLDKFFNTPMDFNPRLTWTNPDRAHHEGVLQFTEELMSACRAINPEFTLSYEGGWDRLFKYTDTSWWGPRDDAMKAAFPQRVLTGRVAQPYDYASVNLCSLYGCHLLVGPGNYTRTFDYPPMQGLLDYITEITRIRQELLDLVSLGEIADASEGAFRRRQPLLALGGSFADSPHARWTVFADVQTGRRCIVLGNMGQEELQVEDLRFTDRPPRACRLYQAFAEPREVTLPAAVTVPAERVVFLAEI
ncbi:MAG: DUF6259 domain-containing protein [Armatimonadota bacterium]